MPIYEKSSFFPSLIRIFGLFYKVYIESNGISSGRYLINPGEDILYDENEKSPIIPKNDEKKSSKSSLLALEFKDIKGKFVKVRNEHMCEIMENEDFNVEDKLFLNRLAFLGFRKFGPQLKFKDFHKYTKKLQVLLLLFTKNIYF